MTLPDAEPPIGLRLLRFAVRGLRITASTVALVALLRQQWLAGAVFSLTWLLILAAPRVIPQLASEPDGTQDQGLPGR